MIISTYYYKWLYNRYLNAEDLQISNFSAVDSAYCYVTFMALGMSWEINARQSGKLNKFPDKPLHKFVPAATSIIIFNWLWL